MTINWHVVVALSGSEKITADKLAKLESIERCFCPMRRVSWLQHGKRVDDLMALVPRIFFARWETLNPYTWHDIMNTLGVHDILRGGALAENDRWVPSVVQEVDIGRWINRADADGVVPELKPQVKIGYELKDKVKIISRDGIYDGITGECIWFDSYDPPKFTCVQSPLGRVYVETEMVEKADDFTSSGPFHISRRSKRRARHKASSLRRLERKRFEALATGTLGA